MNPPNIPPIIAPIIAPQGPANMPPNMAAPIDKKKITGSLGEGFRPDQYTQLSQIS